MRNWIIESLMSNAGSNPPISLGTSGSSGSASTKKCFVVGDLEASILGWPIRNITPILFQHHKRLIHHRNWMLAYILIIVDVNISKTFIINILTSSNSINFTI